MLSHTIGDNMDVRFVVAKDSRGKISMVRYSRGSLPIQSAALSALTFRNRIYVIMENLC